MPIFISSRTQDQRVVNANPNCVLRRTHFSLLHASNRYVRLPTNCLMFCRIEAFLLLFSPTFPLLVGDERYQIRGENALSKMKGWLIHSDWNVKNKLLLIEAELHNTMKDFDMAESCYEASIKAAREHRFIQEESIANELAGIFNLERGQRQRSHSYFKSSLSCYQKWGAFTVVKRIGDFIQNEFGTDLMHNWLADDLPTPASASKISTELSSKKRSCHD